MSKELLPGVRKAKKIQDLYDIGEVWYQRAHKLRLIWQNFQGDKSKAAKAFMLWQDLFDRLMLLRKVIFNLESKHRSRFQKGGI